MLRVFIIRIACISGENASVLLRPFVLWIGDRLSEKLPLSDLDAYKVTFTLPIYICCGNYIVSFFLFLVINLKQTVLFQVQRLLSLLSLLLEHPHGKVSAFAYKFNLLYWFDIFICYEAFTFKFNLLLSS